MRVCLYTCVCICVHVPLHTENKVQICTCIMITVWMFPLTGYDWVLLDSRYLAGVETEISRRQWRDFFSKLGVIDFLSLKAVHLSFTEKELVCSLTVFV